MFVRVAMDAGLISAALIAACVLVVSILNFIDGE